MNVGKVSVPCFLNYDVPDLLICRPGHAKQRHARKAYQSVFEGRTATVEVDAYGWGAFGCPRGGLEVWVPMPLLN